MVTDSYVIRTDWWIPGRLLGCRDSAGRRPTDGGPRKGTSWRDRNQDLGSGRGGNGRSWDNSRGAQREQASTSGQDRYSRGPRYPRSPGTSTETDPWGAPPEDEWGVQEQRRGWPGDRVERSSRGLDDWQRGSERRRNRDGMGGSRDWSPERRDRSPPLGNGWDQKGSRDWSPQRRDRSPPEGNGWDEKGSSDSGDDEVGRLRVAELLIGEAVYGTNPVLAALSAGRRQLNILYVQEGTCPASKGSEFNSHPSLIMSHFFFTSLPPLLTLLSVFLLHPPLHPFPILLPHPPLLSSSPPLLPIILSLTAYPSSPFFLPPSSPSSLPYCYGYCRSSILFLREDLVFCTH